MSKGSRTPIRRTAARATAVFAFLLATCAALAAPLAASALTVCIDAGHGGRYSNANANGLQEKAVNLAVAKALKSRLEAKGYRVVMTRSTDVALEYHDRPTWNWSSRARRYSYGKDGHTSGNPPYDDLQARCDVANKAGADLFISIHCNGVTASSARGFEDYASAGDPLGTSLRGYVNRSVIKATGLHNRGAMRAEFYVLRWTNMPAVLVECGFITNPTEARKLRSPAFRAKIASGIAGGVSSWLGTQPYKRAWARYNGSTAAATAVAASRSDFPGGASTVVVMRSDEWLEAATAPTLSARLAAPLLFAEGSAVPTATAGELARLKPSHVIVAGPSASVDETLVAGIAEAAGVETSAVEVLGGSSRREAAAAVAARVGVGSSGEIVLANQDLAEGIQQATVYAARKHAPLVLTTASSLGSGSQEFVSANRSRIKTVTVFGASGHVQPTVYAGLPSVRRYYSSDRARWTTIPAFARFSATSARTAVVVSAKLQRARLVAASHAGHVNQPVVLTEGAALPVYSRAFVAYRRSALTSFRIIDVDSTIPATVDWALKKSDYPWTPWSGL